MSTTLTIILLVIGTSILAGLAFYAGKLLCQLKTQNAAIQQKVAQRNETLVESITTIAKSMEQGQCEVSEGALRLAVLFDHLSNSVEANYPEQYPAIHGLNEKIKHLAILEERKKLAKQERMKQDLIRVKAEAEFEEQIMLEASKIANFSLN